MKYLILFLLLCSPVLADTVELHDYAIDNTGATNVASGVQAWFTAVVAKNGNIGHADCGHYKISSQINIDFQHALSGGQFNFEPGCVWFDSDSSSTVPAFYFHDSSHADGVLNWDMMGKPKYSSSVIGDTCRLGEEGYGDAFNQLRWDIICENHNTTDTSHTTAAMEINFLDSHSEMHLQLGQSGAANAGDCLRLRKSDTNVYYIGGGNCRDMIHMTGSENNDNVFVGEDIENIYHSAILSDISTNSQNIFMGGLFGCNSGVTAYALMSSAGGSTGQNILFYPKVFNCTGTSSGTTGFDVVTSLTSSPSLPLSVANGGSGTASPAIVAGTNVTVTGSWPNQTINSSGGGGGGTPTEAHNSCNSCGDVAISCAGGHSMTGLNGVTCSSANMDFNTVVTVSSGVATGVHVFASGTCSTGLLASISCTP